MMYKSNNMCKLYKKLFILEDQELKRKEFFPLFFYKTN